MSFLELLLIAIALSMDAFAVAICTGLAMARTTIKKSLIVGLYFGIFQAAMPVIGYILATRFADKITTIDHWIAFILLALIGAKMILEGFGKEDSKDSNCAEDCYSKREILSDKTPDIDEVSLSPANMLPLAIATSIDALAVGVSFAFLRVNIAPAAAAIGVTTLVLSMLGVKIGNIFGAKLKSKAELAGGIILILIGLKILLEHLGMF